MTASTGSPLRRVGGLSAVVLLACALVVGVHALTRDRIEAAQRLAQRQALAIVLPPSLYDNDPLLDSVRVAAPAWLGTDAPVTVRRARRGDHATAMALEAVAPDGYAGPIALLVGVDRTGRITGVRVTAHRETPGLGDAIDIRRSGWIRRFEQRALGDPPEAGWTVKSDGGDFDQFAGATMTPRAVVKAVHRVLALIRKHGDRLYAAPAGSELRFGDAPDLLLPGEEAPP